MQSDLPLYLTVKRAVQHSGYSRSQIYRWLDAGNLAAKKLGRSTYILTASLRAIIDALADYR